MTETQVQTKVLDNDLRKKLAEVGGLGFTENTEFPYTPKMFRKKVKDSDEYILPKEIWPVFTLKGKDGIEASNMEDGMGHVEYDDKNETRKWIGKSGKKRVGLLEDGILGCVRFYDAQGEEITYRAQGSKAHREFIKRIPALIQMDLANAIIERHQLTPEELEGLEF